MEARSRLQRTQVGRSSKNACIMRSTVSAGYCCFHSSIIQSGMEYFRDQSVKTKVSFSLEMVRSTPFTKPFRPWNFRFTASFTASSHTALSGIRSICKIWYTDIRRMVRITGFIFFTFILEH